MGDDAPTQEYIQKNRKVVDDLLIILGSRELLTQDVFREEYEECRKSAQKLRPRLEALMLSVQDGGMLLKALKDMQSACTAFVRTAGSYSEEFYRDHALFEVSLRNLRRVYGQRLELLVEAFHVIPPPEIQRIISAAR